jgi:hypothetical protein
MTTITKGQRVTRLFANQGHYVHLLLQAHKVQKICIEVLVPSAGFCMKCKLLFPDMVAPLFYAVPLGNYIYKFYGDWHF